MKKYAAMIAILLISVIGIVMFLMLLGFRINITDSIPVGLYRMTTIKNLKNSFVIFCPDNRLAFKQGMERSYIDPGFCIGGYGFLMKKVVAVSGDQVSVTSDGVFVNHKRLPYSTPKLRDGANCLLPQWQVLNYRLKADELMTMTSQNEWSFDGRYYGPIRIGQVKGVITPIWIFGEKS